MDAPVSVPEYSQDSVAAGNSTGRPLVCCGLDEAGRGPMAGPVCAAAVILPPDFDTSILDDSKKMTEKRREYAMREIILHAAAWHIGWASPAEIDSINILNASLLAMKRSYEGLLARFHQEPLDVRVLVDGLYCPDVEAFSIHAYPQADGAYPEVMAASILAKTARDRMMVRYDWLYPEYGYARHKGYPTAAHIEVLKKNGPSPIQRNTFRLKGEGQLSLF
ncbi:MAG: ribonuclease HII [Treponema sp.]|jgi:ribonuclease HII|nr:MAG: Ribonuclease HII [Spirochaetes bacterium ADurb.Bin269]TAH54756.1 MAG: ribonuclease HII [Treponema sp.]